MTAGGFLQITLYLLLLLMLVKPLGNYMARVYDNKAVFLTPIFKPVERIFYRLGSVRPEKEMSWQEYSVAMLLFSAAGQLFLYLLQRSQVFLPLNPHGFGPVSADLAFNTASSFVSNTNWQNYSGEQTMSYLTQMMGLTTQNFLSAATGMAIAVAFIRSFRQHAVREIGNFWVDLIRSTLYILLPLALILALILASQGVVQTLGDYSTAQLLQPAAGADGKIAAQQLIALGPVASQEAIKHLGTNGGGFFNANAAHPYENPTPLTNLLLILAETAIPAAFAYTFGKMVGDTRQGWALLAAMLLLFILFGGLITISETTGNPHLAALGLDMRAGERQAGGNMEGKEARFGVVASALMATASTATSTGAVNSLHDSYMPLGGLSLLVLMQLGEVVLGGVGSGLYGMLVFVIVAVFVAGLMVGRTPEYLGKKIEVFEMKMAALIILIMPIFVLFFTALALSVLPGKAGIGNPGAHGLSEVLYAYSSQANNNGSAFAGLSGNSLFYNLTGGVAMLIPRFWPAIATLAIAGSLAAKKKTPVSAGTLPTHSPLFILWVISVVIIVGALNFFPVLALGPVVEHLILWGA
jgi:potassium-transporting ATPase potassium-binding subunit